MSNFFPICEPLRLIELTWIAAELNAPVKPQLAADETIINPYYMRQLLQYGIKLGAAQGETMDSEALLREAEVRERTVTYSFDIDVLFLTASGRGAQSPPTLIPCLVSSFIPLTCFSATYHYHHTVLSICIM